MPYQFRKGWNIIINSSAEISLHYAAVLQK